MSFLFEYQCFGYENLGGRNPISARRSFIVLFIIKGKCLASGEMLNFFEGAEISESCSYLRSFSPYSWFFQTDVPEFDMVSGK